MLVHGLNISQKENHRSKYRDTQSRRLLKQIHEKYDCWHQANMALSGPFSTAVEGDEAVIEQRVQLLEEYKNFIDQKEYAEQFDSRSNLHSSVLEEFLYYLFRDLVSDFGVNAQIGKSHVFKDIFFVPPNFKQMSQSAYARVEEKDHDFVIGVAVEAKLSLKQPQVETDDNNSEMHLFNIPAVVIECKTYLDKTMLEGSSRAAEQLKAKNPNALYIVVMEWLKLTNAVNLRKYELDQIYVLRRQKNTDREFRFDPDYVKSPISIDVVWHLYQYVREHLTTDWEDSIEQGLDRGWLL